VEDIPSPPPKSQENLKGTNQQGRDLNRGKFQYRQLAGTMQADVSLRTAQTIRKILAAEAKSRKHT
jgi:hypothetical protein